jgi:hypothetical protein
MLMHKIIPFTVPNNYKAWPLWRAGHPLGTCPPAYNDVFPLLAQCFINAIVPMVMSFAERDISHHDVRAQVDRD